MKNKSVMPAEVVGASFSRDPELVLPERPRVPPEIVVQPFGTSGLLFEGARGIQVLGGQSARTLLPRILPALDGHHTIEEIGSLFPTLPPGAIHNIISLLHSRGLLENGPPQSAPPGLEDVDAFLGRFVDVTRINRSRHEAGDRLRAARVGIAAGSDEAVALLAAQLAGCGTGEVRIIDASRKGLSECTLLLAVATRESDDLGPILDAAQDASVAAFHVRVSAHVAQIGPLFVPGKSACYACLRQTQGAPPAGEADVAEIGFWLGVATFQVFQLVSRIADPYVYNVIHHHEKTRHGLESVDRVVARMPGCGRCGIEGPPLDPRSTAATTWLFHTSTSMPPRELLSPRAHQNHYNASNIALTRELGDPYYGAPAVPLPHPAPIARPLPWHEPAPGRPGIDVDPLAALLLLAGGYKEIAPGSTWRIAPTGGALGSPEFFVIARGIQGLEDGVYHYDAPRHRLERLRDASPTLLRAALGLDGPFAPCTLVGTGRLGKLRSKYASFSYRLVNLDAGVALCYVHDVAAALGLAIQEYPEVHDQALAEAIGLPVVGNRNVVTFAVGLAGPPAVTGFSELNPPILDTVLGYAQRPSTPPPSRDAPQRPIGPIPRRSTLEDVILGRRSFRTFSDEPLLEPVLREIAGQAAAIVRTRLASGAAPLAVQPWLALNEPAGALRPGVYRVDADDPTDLRLVRDGCRRDETIQCLLQKSLGEAPAVLFVTGDFGAAVARRGARGYRDLLLQAGSAVARGLLVATAHGVEGCASGGMMEEGFRALAGTDGYRECLLFAAALGHALPE